MSWRLPRDLNLPPEKIFTFLRSRRSCRVFAEKEVPSSKSWRNWWTSPVMHPRGITPKISNFWSSRAKNESGNWPNVQQSSTETCTRCSALREWMYLHGCGRIWRGFRLNWEYYQQGKDRIFRNAPALIIIHAQRRTSLRHRTAIWPWRTSCSRPQAMGVGTCIIGYLITAAERDPSIIQGLDIPQTSKIFTCCTVGYPKLTFRKCVQRKPPAVRWL